MQISSNLHSVDGCKSGRVFSECKQYASGLAQKADDNNLNVFERLNRPKSSQQNDKRTIQSTNQNKQVKQTCRKQGVLQADQSSILNGNDQISAKKGQITRPATQLIQDLYYDHFARNKKKEKMHQESLENKQKILIQKSQENLHKQNMVLAQRITGRVQKAFIKVLGADRLNKVDADIIDFSSFMSILQELFYLDSGQDQGTNRNLAFQMWNAISRIKINKHQLSNGSEISLVSKVNNSTDNNEQCPRFTSLRDIELYILAIENVHFLKTNFEDKTPLNIDQWLLDKYNLFDQNFVKKISNQYKQLVQHRKNKLSMIVQEKEMQHFKKINRFEPKINKKSELLLNLKPERQNPSSRGISARLNNTRVHSRDRASHSATDLQPSTLRSQRTFSGSRTTLGQRQQQQQVVIGIAQGRGVGARQQTGRGQGRGQINIDQKKIILYEQVFNPCNPGTVSDEIDNQFTFSPKINDFLHKQKKKNQRNISQQRLSQNRSSSNQRARSFETTQRQGTKMCEQLMQETRRSVNSNVFLNLYKIAKERQEKSADSQRQAMEQIAQREAQECTFKPDFSKTCIQTKLYLERRENSQQAHKKVSKKSISTKRRSKQQQSVHNPVVNVSQLKVGSQRQKIANQFIFSPQSQTFENKL